MVLSLDISAHMGAEYKRLADEFARDEEVDLGIPLTVERSLVINYKVGAEFTTWPTYPIRVGAFTNFSANQFDAQEARLTPVGSDESVLPPMSAAVDLVGITASVGYKGSETALNVGLNVETSISGTDTVLLDLDNPASGFFDADREETRVIIFLAGDLEFLDDWKDRLDQIENLKGQLENLDDLDDEARERLMKSLDNIADPDNEKALKKPGEKKE